MEVRTHRESLPHGNDSRAAGGVLTLDFTEALLVIGLMVGAKVLGLW